MFQHRDPSLSQHWVIFGCSQALSHSKRVRRLVNLPAVEVFVVVVSANGFEQGEVNHSRPLVHNPIELIIAPMAVKGFNSTNIGSSADSAIKIYISEKSLVAIVFFEIESPDTNIFILLLVYK